MYICIIYSVLTNIPLDLSNTAYPNPVMYNLLFAGSAAYIDGGLVYCGGYNIKDASVTPLKTCYSLKHPAPGWGETFPLLQDSIAKSIQHKLTA